MFEKIKFGKTLVYKVKTNENDTVYNYQKDKSFCDLRMEEYPNHVVKHICDTCATLISKL